MVVDGIKPANADKEYSTIKPVAPKHTVHPNKAIAAHQVAHKLQHAKTLRRDIVKPPTITPQKSLKLQTPTDLVRHNPDVLTVVPKLSSDVVDPARASRALAVPHSPQIERFRKQPVQRPHIHAAPIRPAHRSAAGVTHRTVSPPGSHQVMSTQKTVELDVFEQAIAYAKSHEQPMPKAIGKLKVRQSRRRHKKVVGAIASVIMLAFLGGFIFWQNRANIELQLASARSGVPASMPAYRPNGYAVMGMTYNPGTVTIGFSGKGGNFTVVQKTSNWDSVTLLQNYVATSGQTYSTYQAAGRTVYIYGNENATWVNGGIWYQVNDNGQLNKSQLINLATSM